MPRGDKDHAITVGFRMLTLRRLVDTADGLFRARTEELPLMTCYANSIAHLFERRREASPVIPRAARPEGSLS